MRDWAQLFDGSPMTFITRPSVRGPTEESAHLIDGFHPRTMPSVAGHRRCNAALRPGAVALEFTLMGEGREAVADHAHA